MARPNVFLRRGAFLRRGRRRMPDPKDGKAVFRWTSYHAPKLVKDKYPRPFDRFTIGPGVFTVDGVGAFLGYTEGGRRPPHVTLRLLNNRMDSVTLWLTPKTARAIGKAMEFARTERRKDRQSYLAHMRTCRRRRGAYARDRRRRRGRSQ